MEDDAQSTTGRRPLAILERRGVAWGLVTALFAAQALRHVARRVEEQDPFWLAAAGRTVWETGTVPRENLFSFVAPSYPWICHELGFALLYAKGLAWMGPAFFALSGMLCGAVTVAIIAAHVASQSTRRATLAVVLLAVLMELVPLAPSPIFASLGFVAATIALAFGDDGKVGLPRAALSVIVVWAWAQFHGSFPLGVVLLGAAALEGSRRRAKLATAAVAAAATVLNPYGLRLHGLVAGYAAGASGISRTIHEHITEFLPIWKAPHAFGHFDAEAVALLAMLALHALVRGDKMRVRASVALVLTLLAVYQARNVQLAVVACSMLLARHVDRSLARLLPESPQPNRAWRGASVVAPGGALALVVFGVLVDQRPREAWLGSNLGGPDVVALLASVPDSRNVYAPFGVSPAVMWYGAPRGIRVLYDPRNDCYPPDVALAALRIEYDEGARRDAASTVASYATQFAFARRKSEVEASFERSEAWRPVAQRGELSLFARR